MQNHPVIIGLSARNRRILALGVHGAAGDEPLTPEQLIARAESHADLTDDDIATLSIDLETAVRDVLSTPSDAALEQADELMAARDTLATAVAAREAETARIDAAVAERLAKLTPTAGPEDDEPADGEGEGEGEGTGTQETVAEIEPVVEETPAAEVEEPEAEIVPLAASSANTSTAGTTAVISRVAARRPDITKPRPRKAPEFKLVASANAPGIAAGQVLETPEMIANVFEQALRASGSRHVGPNVNVPLFSLGAFNPEEIFGKPRTLGRDAIGNEQKILDVTSEKALRASGGICAPVPVQYDLPILGVSDRPVRDALARFGATRGGVRLLPPPSLSDVTGAVGVWTEANDVSPSSPATKPCLTLDCPDETETLVAAITQCLKIGNFRARFFPEQIEAWTRLVAVQAARIADTRIIQKIGDESTQVSTEQVLGTTRTVLAALDRAGAALRSHQRLSPDFPLRLLAPAWLLDNMISDLTRQAPGDNMINTSDAQINGWLGSRGINVSWFLDGEAGQIFGPQVDGELNGWPTNVICYLYVEGTWLHLDAGMLDFGIVRDSTLNATNDFEIFSEIFEEAAFHGVPGTSYRLDIDICPSGQAAALVDTSGICAGGS